MGNTPSALQDIARNVAQAQQQQANPMQMIQQLQQNSQQISNLSNITTPALKEDTTRETIEQKRIELNMAKSDVKLKQSELDELAPDEASKRLIQEYEPEIQRFLNGYKTKINYEMKLFENSIKQIDVLTKSDAMKMAEQYRENLKERLSQVNEELKKNKEDDFTNRRRFLDADPQSGLDGIGPFKTIDDQIMIFFWIVFVLFIGTVSGLLIFDYLGEGIESSLIKIVIWTVSIIVAVLAANTGIRVYG